jgi:diguanylate cyclase (GGDEF)-like protein
VTHLLIGISAALGAVVLVLGTVLLRLMRRSRRREDERVGRVVQTLEARMDELGQELAGAVERAEEEGRRSRFLGEIAGTIELDEVLGRTLQAIGQLPGADAAVVRLDTPGGEPLVAAHGVRAEDAAQQAVPRPPDGRPTRAVEVVFTYLQDGAGEDAVHAGLAVPLENAGVLSVYTRDPERRFAEADMRRLEDLAGRAAPAIENARRFREARMLADLDALTDLHNRRYFHETLARECVRAQRYHRGLALLVFDIDDFKTVNDRIGHLGGDAALAEAARRVRDVVRSADIACRVGGDEFAVILPEAAAEQAEQLFDRIQAALAAAPIAQAGRLRASAGVAELEADDDAITLFERADEALYRAKAAGKAQAQAAIRPVA